MHPSFAYLTKLRSLQGFETAYRYMRRYGVVCSLPLLCADTECLQGTPRTRLSPVVQGLAEVFTKIVVCGTSLSLEDVTEAIGSFSMKPAGQKAGRFTMIVKRLKPFAHAEFRTLLRNCLREPARLDEFDLPPSLFPGMSLWRSALLQPCAWFCLLLVRVTSARWLAYGCALPFLGPLSLVG